MADTLAHKNRRTSSLRKADAILEEFREPTEAMTQGGVEACAYHGAIVEMDVLSAWRGMIDKAKDER